MSIKFDSLPISLPNNTTFAATITSRYGPRHVRSNPNASRFHRGIDLAFPGCRGTPVYSVAPGKVIAAGYNATAGNFVTIEHTEDDGVSKFRTSYCHMLDGSITVPVGEFVADGIRLGTIGDTGNPTPGAYHLHFTLKSLRLRGEQAIDPLPYLQRVGIAIPVSTGPTPSAPPPTTYAGSAAAGSVSAKISGLYSFHPHIQYELTRRRNATETANTYMPYVKLTSLVNVLGDNVVGGTSGSIAAYCPTLGLHGEEEQSFTEMYTPVSKRSIIGYATKKDGTGRVAVVVKDTDLAIDPPNIPPPGIVSMTTERSTAGAMGVRGGLFRANIKIVAYSVGQMNALLRYYLRPATRVVLELGRQSSSENEIFAADTGQSDGDRTFTPFDWSRSRAEIDGELESIVRLSNNQDVAQERFLRKYIYDNFGNYEIYIGYVVTFKFRYTKSNTYEIDLTVHSAQQFEVPIKLTGARALCGPKQASIPSNCGVLDIEDYFSPNSSYKGNSFSQLLAKAVSADDTTVAPVWGNHVIKLLDAVRQGETGDTTYLISWAFFIDMVLNDETHGLASIFQSSDSPKTLEFLKNSFPKPIGGLREGQLNEFINQYEVGWHENLRSTDAGVMVIDNPKAQPVSDNENRAAALQNLGIIDQTTVDNLANSKIYQEIFSKGRQIGKFNQTQNNKGVSSLTGGVWLNSNAIIDSFANADTVSAALNSLLVKMNNATQGFWNLQVLSNDQGAPGIHIIDMGESKPNTQPIRPADKELSITGLRQNFKAELEEFRAQPGTNIPQYLYKFNRGLKRGSNTSTGSGGELLDINYEASLPQVIAVQAIAGVGGVAQRGTLAAIDIAELKRITLYDIYPDCSDSAADTCAEAPRTPRDVPTTGYKFLTDIDLRWITRRWQEAKDEEAKTAVDEEIEVLETVFRGRIEEQTRYPNIVLTEEETKFALEQGYTQATLDELKAKPDRPSIGSNVNDLTKLIRARRLRTYDDEFNADVAKAKQQSVAAAAQQNASYINLLNEYSGMYGMAIAYIAYDKTKMMQAIDLNRTDEEVHPFNSSNLTKTTIDLTLPGIGGLSLFEAFAVDRIPDILTRGYYIVTRIAHEFTTAQGWITKIQGRFRYKPSLQTSSAPAAIPAGDPMDDL